MKLRHQTRRDNASYRSVVGPVHGVTCAAAALRIILARVAEVLALLLEATLQSPTHQPFSPSIVLSLAHAHAQINQPLALLAHPLFGQLEKGTIIKI